MLAVSVTFEIQPGALVEFLPLMLRQAEASREEDGCRRFDVAIDETGQGPVFLYELYDDRAAFDIHLASAHFLDFDRTTKPLVRSREIRTWSVVSLADS